MATTYLPSPPPESEQIRSSEYNLTEINGFAIKTASLPQSQMHQSMVATPTNILLL
jgi:hypothetical protein